jgi:hypothetical protein
MGQLAHQVKTFISPGNSPVTNVKIAVKNMTASLYVYDCLAACALTHGE